jgi:hypothetical protein
MSVQDKIADVELTRTGFALTSDEALVVARMVRELQWVLEKHGYQSTADLLAAVRGEAAAGS